MRRLIKHKFHRRKSLMINEDTSIIAADGSNMSQKGTLRNSQKEKSNDDVN